MSLVVNLEEFSELCRVTPETMRGYIRAVEGAPDWLIERGDRGRGYKIEAQGGVAWWKALRADEEARAAEHADTFAQLRLEILGEKADDSDQLVLSGKARREEYAAALDRIKLRRMMGELLERAEIEPLLANAAVELRRRLSLVPGEFAAQHGLSPEEVAPLREMIGRAVEDFVGAITMPPRPDRPDA